ncbi:MAG: hypothetical protein M3Z54_04155 [Gemmatimonadota bacterium]|nr:hypothetical protein [Gemmatimonadota bacterium]
MATGVKKGEEEGGEFADFMADISDEIAQRVESLDPAPKSKPNEKKATPSASDAGVILEWENVADRMIEEMR